METPLASRCSWTKACVNAAKFPTTLSMSSSTVILDFIQPVRWCLLQQHLPTSSKLRPWQKPAFGLIWPEVSVNQLPSWVRYSGQLTAG